MQYVYRKFVWNQYLLKSIDTKIKKHKKLIKYEVAGYLRDIIAWMFQLKCLKDTLWLYETKTDIISSEIHNDLQYYDFHKVSWGCI